VSGGTGTLAAAAASITNWYVIIAGERFRAPNTTALNSEQSCCSWCSGSGRESPQPHAVPACTRRPLRSLMLYNASSTTAGEVPCGSSTLGKVSGWCLNLTAAQPALTTPSPARPLGSVAR
jgi:hypothetical protein